jgi:hypothetical protein
MSAIRRFLHNNNYLIALILISAITYLPWITGGKYITFGDSSVYLPNTQRDLVTNALSIYTSNTSLGALQIMSSYNPILMLYGLLADIHIYYSYALRILLLWPYIILTPLYSYKLGNKILKSKISAFVTSVIILLNTCTLMLVRGGLLIFFADTLFIIFFYYLWCLMNEGYRTSDLLKLQLSGLLLAAYEFRIFYISVFVCTLYVIYKLLLTIDVMTEKIKATAYWIFTLSFITICNLFWILPFKNLGAIQNNSIFDRSLFGNQYFDISSSLALFHRFWTGGVVIPFTDQPIPLYFWIIPLAVGIGLLLNNRRNKDLYFFSIVALVGVLLTKQVGAPFYGLYQWLYDNFPGFNAFREASKFYILIILGYAIVIGSIFVPKNTRLIESKYPLKRIQVGFAIVITGLFLFNTVPFVTRTFGVLLVPKTIPSYYQQLNGFLDKEKDFFRTYWVVEVSRWGSYDNNKPAVSGTDVLSTNWDKLFNQSTATEAVSNQDTIEFTEPFSSELFNLAGFKYIILPSRDIKSDDDFYQERNRSEIQNVLSKVPWLTRANAQNASVGVYRNKYVTPYFSSQPSIVHIDSYLNTYNKFSFINSSLKENYLTTTSAINNPTYSIKDPLEASRVKNISNGQLTFIQNAKNTDYIYLKKNYSGYSYQVVNNSIVIYSNKTPNISLNGSNIAYSHGLQVIANQPLDRTKGYNIYDSSEALSLNLNDNVLHNLGNINGPLKIYAYVKTNLAQQPANNGLWKENVEDCNKYNNSSLISLGSQYSNVLDKDVAQLTAQSHIACTGPPEIPLGIGVRSLVLSFKYSVVQGTEAGYELIFNNPKNTKVTNYINSPDSMWRTQDVEVNIPAGASKVRLLFESVPGEQAPIKSIVDYADVQTFAVSSQDTLVSSTESDGFQKLDSPVRNSAKVTLENNSIKTNNLIKDPSFKSGLWQKHVNDCHDYDNKPSIGMKIINGGSSRFSNVLDLYASRHIACTSPKKIPVMEGGSYFISFDYENRSLQSSRYKLTFNDPNKTVINKSLTYVQDEWSTESSYIQIPEGATQMTLTLYSIPDELAHQKAVNWFDNFSFNAIPISSDSIYLVNGDGIQYDKPKSVKPDIVNPTLKTVKIYGANGKLFLLMSEAYDSNWHLQIGKSIINSNFANHLNVDSFENGWLININKLCKENTKCTVNADGTYNVTFTVKYAQQRYFYVGLILGSTAFITVVSFLIWKIRREKNDS